VDSTTLHVLLVVFFATLVRSTFGFGEGLIAVPLLALVIPIGIAAPVVVLLSMTIAAIVVAQDWRKIHVRSTGWLLAPTFVGIPLGVWLLTSSHPHIVKAALAVVIVAGAYYYAKWRVENALKRVPEKIGLEIQQSAQGFTVSKSEGGRTLFKVQASKAIQYKQGGRAELHDVAITLYGRDSTRFDQIYGSDFEYDSQSGDIIAKGQVQIDLEANPEGLGHADQAVPRELKNPIHLKTSGLVFNQKTGDAHTQEKVEFRIPQASGTAEGASYQAKENVLLLHSHVQIEFGGASHATVNADRAW